MKIAVFDSGSGGLSTLAAIRQLLPEAELLYFGDHAHHPYGNKTPAELLQITSQIVQKFSEQGVQIVVIACNTATTTCIRPLRQLFPDITFIGTEPAVKIASDHHAENALLLTTVATAKSPRLQFLLQKYDLNHHITTIPCPGLADAIENALNLPSSFHLQPRQPLPSLELPTTAMPELTTFLQNLIPIADYDHIILGCTHYTFIRPLLQNLFPTATIVDGNAGVARRVRSVALAA